MSTRKVHNVNIVRDNRHIKKNYFDRIKGENVKQGGPETGKGKKPKANKVGLITLYFLGVQENAYNWVVDSGNTCHICNSKELFKDFYSLPRSEVSPKVTAVPWKQLVPVLLK